jgi:hypothetical protein
MEIQMPIHSTSVCFAAVVFMASASVAAANDAFESCPVTKPSDAFIPPPPYKSQRAPGSIFFGTPKLWTLVWIDGWQGRKLVWWSPGNDQKTTLAPGLSVTFTRLDAREPQLATDHSNWGHIPDQPAFITTGLNFPPDRGCWEITGRLGGEEVKYVVWVGARPAK